jgi:lipopolysaccharide export system permease protein
MREVLASVLLVLVAFLALFTFFNFVDELRNVGRADYTAGRAALLWRWACLAWCMN